MNNYKLRFSAIVTGLILLIPGSLQAGGVIEEITVTAQKRDQNLQDVPISIEAIAEAQLRDRHLEEPLDVAYKTPGMVGAVRAGVPSFSIRGIGTNDFGTAADPAVGIYIDGVYTSRTVAAILGLYDAQRVEVVKGPQGTLFGRSAAAGAISIISNKPDEEFAASVTAQAGNLDNRKLSGMINVPLSDTAFLRVSALSHSRDGYIDNTLNGSELADIDDKGIRAALRFVPSDTLEITLSADYLESDTNGVGLKSATIPFAGDNGSYFSDVAQDLLNPVSELTNKGIALHIEKALGDDLTLTSITAVRDYEFDLLEDDDGSFLTLLSTGTDPEESESFSQEFRLNGTIGDSTDWMLGLSYYSEDNSVVGIAQSDLDILFGPGSGGPFEERSYSDGDFTSWSVYTDFTYRMNEQWTLIAGVRWSRDEKDFSLHVPPNPLIGFNLLFSGVDPEVKLDKSWTSTQPRLVVQYQHDDDTMLYLSAARGYKPGGFGSFELQPPFDPEFVWNYEAGVKTTLADGRLRLNAALFRYDYEDLQVTTQVGLALQTTNASEATGKGIEVGLTWRPVEELEVVANIAYLDAEYDKFIQGELDPFTFLPITSDRSGNDLTRAPELQYNLSIDYTSDIMDSGALGFRVEYMHQSEMYFHAANDDFRSQDSYGLVSARISFIPHDGSWQASLFGENLNDEEYLLDAGGLAEILLSPVTFAGPPRTYGMELRFDF